MKKILFGLIALSSISFAANPGTEATASVPVEVKAEILAQSASLQITDISGNLLNKIVLDHGQITKGLNNNDSIISQDFKVVKQDGSGELAEWADGDKMEISIDSPTTTLKNGANELESSLSLVTDTNLTVGATEHKGTISSEILGTNISSAVVGSYNNSSERTLTVVYTPNN
ncbi:MAG: hypothetical protein ACRCZ2_08715 [Fusobacteriaceae bacterium]